MMKKATDQNIMRKVRTLVGKRDHLSALMKNKDCLMSLERYLHSSYNDVVLMTIDVFNICVLGEDNRIILYNIPKLTLTLNYLSTLHKCRNIRQKATKLLHEIDPEKNAYPSPNGAVETKIQALKANRYIATQLHLIKLRVSNISDSMECRRFLNDAVQLSVVVSATMGTDMKNVTLYCTTEKYCEVVTTL